MGYFQLLIAPCSLLTFFLSLFTCTTSQPTPVADTPPNWLHSLEQTYPSREWIAVTAQGSSQSQAEAAALPNQATFDAYVRLSFAHAIAQITDNSQNILEVLDPTAANQRPAYGGANAVRAKMLECAALITIGIAVDTEQSTDKTLFARAAGSYFRDLGFRINEQGTGTYVLHANARFELISQSVVSRRYYLNAAVQNPNGAVIFAFTEDDRKAHPNTASEARRLAVQAVEISFKEGKFAQEFSAWLYSFLE
jgi:hypothetical protein